MSDTISEQEAAVMACLLVIEADGDIRQDELSAMLANPFFDEHLAGSIGPHMDFIQKFNQAKAKMGMEKIEELAVSVLNKGLPAFRHKTLALMTLIANADGEFDDREQEVINRMAETLDVSKGEMEAELEKMEKLAETNAKQEKPADQPEEGDEDKSEEQSEEQSKEESEEKSEEKPESQGEDQGDTTEENTKDTSDDEQDDSAKTEEG